MENKQPQPIPIQEANEIELIVPSVIIEDDNYENNTNKHAKECQCRTCHHHKRQQRKKDSCCSWCDSADDDDEANTDAAAYITVFACAHDDNGSGCCWCCCECINICDDCDCNDCCDCDES